MTRLLTLTMAMLLCASIATAQGIGLYVGSDCSGPASVTNACTTNAGTAFTLFGTCVVPTSGVPSFVEAFASLDVKTALATIPDWWRFDGCRTAPALSAKTDATIVGTVCSHSVWDGFSTVFTLFGPTPQPDVSRMRFGVSAAVDQSEVHNLTGDGTTELAVFSLSVLNTKTVGSGSCAGCSQGACIVLNEIDLLSTGAPAVLRLTTPIAGRNYVTYNGGSPNCPASTPTRNSSWGTIKAMYR